MSHEPRYILNQLYIKDFLIWLQQCSESLIESLRTTLDDVSFLKNYIFLYVFIRDIYIFFIFIFLLIIKVHLNKVNVGLDLEELEAAGHHYKQFVIANTIHETTEQMNILTLRDTEEMK